MGSIYSDSATDPSDYAGDLCGRCEKPTHLCNCPARVCWDCDKRWRVNLDGKFLCLGCAQRRIQRKLTVGGTARLRNAAQALLDIVDDSEGVAGWHLNGELAKWSEFEAVDNLRKALEEARQ